jgi:hypothetical protein
MNTKTEYYNKKPLESQENKQLFAIDINKNGAKKWVFDTYDNIYNIINNNDFNYYNEDHTFNKKIKLHIDIDVKQEFITHLERDKCGLKLVLSIIPTITDKIYKEFNINNPPIIVLISNTLEKLSLHLIFPTIIFTNIVDMKMFMCDVDIIDHNIYKVGCFRMYKCSKLEKYNKLILFETYNYDLIDDYTLFLDSCICHNNNITPITFSKKTPITTFILNNNLQYNYIYKNIDYDKIKKALNQLKHYNDNYNDWILIGFCIKDLYLNCDINEQNYVYSLFDEFSKNSNKYNEYENINIFNKLEPIVDINYLFILADIKYYILPFYNYNEIMFNPKLYNNIQITNIDKIKINLNNIKHNKFIFIKSPCGTGKTTILTKIIEYINIKKIISITSRVNLAGEHVKHLGLFFYQDLNLDDYYYCDNIVIQLESLYKINYKLFKNGVIILDEVNSLLSHFRSSTLNNKRKHIYLYFIEIIKNAKYVICLDADLSNWNIDFMLNVDNKPYFIYYNTIINKKNIDVIFYNSIQKIIDIMVFNIQNNKYFIACFDSLTIMNDVIEYLARFNDSTKWLIYSSKIKYSLIDTSTWVDKFVFFSPTIVYGVDFNHKQVDVFSIINKSHLNPLQVYQMISRARQQNNIHIYCNNKFVSLKYKSIEDVKLETQFFIDNFKSILPNYKEYIDLDIDDEPYEIMYYNHKFIDSILKTNIKDYLIDMITNKGYNIIFNYDDSNNNFISNKNINKNIIKEKIIDILHLDKNNLDDFHTKLVSDDKFLEKHFNFRIFFNNNVDDKIIKSLDDNIFIETIHNKFTKLKICKELLECLSINSLNELTKNITTYFNNTINNQWLYDNINTIKKIFNIRTNKYDKFNYYNIYLLLITIIKHLFDNDIIIKKHIYNNKQKCYYYILNNAAVQRHVNIINKVNYIDFID